MIKGFQLKKSKFLVAGLLVSALVACSKQEPVEEVAAESSETEQILKIELPTPAGPHQIGVVDFELVDNGREESFKPGTPRRIPVRAWFPASSVSGAPKLYANDLEMEHIFRASNTAIPQTEAAIAARENLPTHSYEKAVPLAEGDGRAGSKRKRADGTAAHTATATALVAAHGVFHFIFDE